jgi:flavorubredoxin
MHYSLIGKMRLLSIDSDLLYTGALLGRFDCIHIIFKQQWEKIIKIVKPIYDNTKVYLSRNVVRTFEMTS